MPSAGYTGQAVQPSVGMRDQGMSPEEKLASMRQLLTPDLLGLLSRIIQSGSQTPPTLPPGAEQWNSMHQMPPARMTPEVLRGINGGATPGFSTYPMMPVNPTASFVRG